MSEYVCGWCGITIEPGRYCSAECASAHLAYQERCTEDDDRNAVLVGELNVEFGVGATSIPTPADGGEA
jgi:hypothetical protein